MTSEAPGALDLVRADVAAVRAGAADDPFTNAYLLAALRLTERLGRGELDLQTLEAVVAELRRDAFADRAARLRDYLDAPGAERDGAALRTLFERLADGGFDRYAAALQRPAAGVVFTAHPTFALDEPLSLALAELAAGEDEGGTALDAEAREARLSLARTRPHLPPDPLTLDVEHAWSTRAVCNAAGALDEARRVALEVGRARFPERWAELEPRLLTLATWVGFDQDGRTDVTWDVSLLKRLQLKADALRGRLADARRLEAAAAAELLSLALELVERQVEAAQGLAGLEGRAQAEAAAALSRRLMAEREAALVDPAPLSDALAQAAELADGERRADLLVLRAGVLTQGAGLAHIHVRLNSAQLHNAVRAEVGLDTSPADPANRRSYFAAITARLEGAQPRPVSFRDLLVEPASARRLFVTIAQMAKTVDAASPVRFLIAETESGFTLLAALYFARLYGVEHLVEISPLFETQEALHRGEAVIEEALRSSHYRDYLRARGRLAVQFGFSDSGRFIGQLAAAFRIERLRLRLAELLEREGLGELEVILFNTHGESMGRGGHPASLQDRLRYAAPPRDRADWVRRGLRVREEDSFQGGDGYLPFFTPALSRATVRGVLQWAYAAELGDGEAGPDPIYDAPAYAAEFFATVEQQFEALSADGDYPALLGLFGQRLGAKTGSRPDTRAGSGAGRVATPSRVSDLRAIPNNAVLQGLGELANSTVGVGAAAAKDARRFGRMRERSPRFRRALRLAETAHALGDLQAARAYAATVNPSLWLDRRAPDAADDARLRLLTGLAERAGLTGRLSRVLRRLRAEPPFPAAPDAVAPERAERVRLVHALRIGLIQQAALIAARIPPFAPRPDFDVESLRQQVLRMDLEGAAATLDRVFPHHLAAEAGALDFGEPSEPREAALGYAQEAAALTDPLRRIHALLVQLTACLNHDLGACG